MSILLESLKQSEKPEHNDIPSLSDSHFDDEMLSDEWLLARVKFWKTAAFGTLFLLVLVLVAGYFYWPKIEASPTEISPSSITHTINPNPSASLSHSKLSEAADLRQSDSVKNSLNNISKDQQIPKYQPKIVVTKRESKISNRFSTEKYPVNQEAAISKLAQNKLPISFESLNAQERREFPELAINSYAVSSNPAKSFVVLNGAFYGPGETIAPHLKLVLIDDDGIVISYKNRLIRKKHEL
jgi:hypothetical protein